MSWGRFSKFFRPFCGLFFPIKDMKVQGKDFSCIQWATHCMPHLLWNQVQIFKSYIILWMNPSISLKLWSDLWQFTTINKIFTSSLAILLRIIKIQSHFLWRVIEFFIWDFISFLEFAIISKWFLNCIICQMHTDWAKFLSAFIRCGSCLNFLISKNFYDIIFAEHHHVVMKAKLSSLIE